MYSWIDMKFSANGLRSQKMIHLHDVLVQSDETQMSEAKGTQEIKKRHWLWTKYIECLCEDAEDANIRADIYKQFEKQHITSRDLIQ